MAKTYNLLILDDNKIIADCILSRMIKANEDFLETTQVDINPAHLQIETDNLSKTGQEIEKYLIDNKIHFLILDRGFFEIIDPAKQYIDALNVESLYIKKADKGIKILEILKEINFSKIKSLKGIILYTYDEPSLTSEWYVDPVKIKKELGHRVEEILNSDCIDVVLTNSEIYRLANLKLYDNNPTQIGDYLELGKKSDFMLYGLFMGEILYHRVLKLIDHNRQRILSKKKSSLSAKLILLFIVFSSLSIGGNAIYTLAMKEIQSNIGLLLLSLVFSILFPLLILAIRPELVINIDDDK